MGAWKPWYSGALVIAVLLSLTIVYHVGKKTQLAADQDAAIKAKIVVSDSVSKSITLAVDSAKKSSDILTTYRAKVRAKVEVNHDTITVHDSVVVVSPEIAQLIQADDSTIAALKNTVALQDTLIASLRVGLSLRDTRIALLEKPNSKTSRFITAAKWLTTGVVVGLAVAHR